MEDIKKEIRLNQHDTVLFTFAGFASLLFTLFLSVANNFVGLIISFPLIFGTFFFPLFDYMLETKSGLNENFRKRVIRHARGWVYAITGVMFWIFLWLRLSLSDKLVYGIPTEVLIMIGILGVIFVLSLGVKQFWIKELSSSFKIEPVSRTDIGLEILAAIAAIGFVSIGGIFIVSGSYLPSVEGISLSRSNILILVLSGIATLMLGLFFSWRLSEHK